MKRITLAMMLAAVTAIPALAGTQIPPTPPARPAPQPAQPAEPADRPSPAPRAVPARPMWPMDEFEVERLREQAAEMARKSWSIDADAWRLQSREFAEQAREAARLATENFRLDNEHLREMSRDAARLATEAMRDFHPMTPMPAWTPMAPMPAMPPMPTMEPMPAMSLNWNVSGERGLPTPPAPWAQGDPADSVYRIARNALNGGDYGRAAKIFSDLVKNYPRSSYAIDAPYWEAQARYRIGTTEELRTAAKLLEPMVGKISPSAGSSGQRVVYAENSSFSRRMNDNDVAALYVRINGVLAQRGDAKAREEVDKWSKQSGGAVCDQEDMQVKVEALNALSQMDAGKSTEIIRGILSRKDECSTSLRRNAVFMLGRRNDTESATMLIGVAKSDPSTSVRSEAISALARVPGDAGFTALEELLRTDTDEHIQRSVVNALMRSDNQKARNSMRALIDRKDAPINLRIEAINSFNSERATNEDAAYLRGLYSKAESDNFKRAIIDAVSRIGGPDSDAWVLALAMNPNESSSVRGSAISRMMRSNISVAQIAKLYDAADAFNMRSQIVNVLRGRKEPEAADKLLDIAKNSTDYKIKQQAIQALSGRNDPRAQQLLLEIFKP